MNAPAPPAPSRALSAALLGAAVLLAVVLRPPDPDRRIAEAYLGQCEAVPGAFPPAFRSGERAVVFFERAGVQGKIRGVLFLEGLRVADVRLLECREGHNGRVLADPAFLGAFRGREARAPLVVDARSGASVSSRVLMDAVDERLAWWSEVRAK